MNPIFTEHAVPDLEETITGRPDGYVVPKPRAAEDVRRIAAQLERLEEKHGLPFGSTKLILIATETPQGLLNIGEVAAASPRIAAISWGIEDLSAAMGLPRVRDEAGRYLDIPRYARVMCAVAASAAGVEALDTVYTDIPDLEGLRRECRDGVAMGFGGKISIHPSQIEVINQEFTPSKAEAEDALALIAAFEEHAKKGAGAFTWKGQMMDQPHLTRAKKIAERARRAGAI
jgi:citrate lyase subunit beta/citryl-CoA lyase